MNKWSVAYQLLRYYVYLVHLSFYRKIRVRGKENIPRSKPVIFAPNHQNALMDPMGVLFTQGRQTIFLTRADIFNNPLLLKIFTFLKMLPVYRIRDGADSLQNNERIFNESVRVLESKDRLALALFPEARHTDKRHLWPLKKAVQRIAFRAMEKNRFETDVQIVPVGIYYSDYPQSQSTLQINYGKPIAVKDFEATYNENPQKGMAALKEKMTERIKEQMIHIEQQDYNDTFEHIRLLNRSHMIQQKGLHKKDFFLADQETIRLLDAIFEKQPDIFKQIHKQSESLIQQAQKLNISEPDDQRFTPLRFIAYSLLSLLSLPLFIYAVANHFWSHRLITNFLNKKVKDKQFHSSIKFGAGLVATVTIFPIQAGIFAIFLPELFWYYLLSLPLSAWLGLKCKYLYRSWAKQFRSVQVRSSQKKAFKVYSEARTKLVDQLQELWSAEEAH